MKNDKVQQNLVVMEFHLKMLQGYLDKFKVYFDELQNKLRHDKSKEAYNELDGLLGVEHLEVDVVGDIKHMIVYEDYFSVLPKLHYSSFLVTWYSLLENGLKMLCILCEKELNITKSADKINYLKGFKDYLINAEVKLEEEAWDEVDFIRRLRNKIVHMGPDYDKKLDEYSEPDLKSYIDKNRLMSDGKYKSLFIHYDYCQSLLNFTSSFFFRLSSEIDTLISICSKVRTT